MIGRTATASVPIGECHCNWRSKIAQGRKRSNSQKERLIRRGSLALQSAGCRPFGKWRMHRHHHPLKTPAVKYTVEASPTIRGQSSRLLDFWEHWCSLLKDMLPKITALRVHAVNGRGEFGTGFFNKGSELVGGTSRTSPVTAACSGDGFYAGF